MLLVLLFFLHCGLNMMRDDSDSRRHVVFTVYMRTTSKWIKLDRPSCSGFDGLPISFNSWATGTFWFNSFKSCAHMNSSCTCICFFFFAIMSILISAWVTLISHGNTESICLSICVSLSCWSYCGPSPQLFSTDERERERVREREREREIERKRERATLQYYVE